MADTQDFKDAFEDENVELNDVMADSVKSLGVQYKMTASDLAGEYVMFLINRLDNNFELNPARLEQFTMHLQNENKKKKVTSDSTNDFHLYSRDDLDNLTEVAMDPFKQHPEPIRSRPFSSTDKMAPGTPGTAPGTPGRSPGGSNWKSPAATHAYSERPQRNVVQVALNEHIPRSDASVTPMNVDSGVTQQRVQVEILEGGLKPGTRFMYEQLQDTVSAMEERILAFADALKDQHGIAEFMPVHTATQEKAVIVGRVVCDGEGRLNASAVLLEGSVKQSGGRRIRLELRDIPHFSLFPGQIIAAEGFNPSGHCFTVTRLYTSCPAPMVTTPSTELAATSAISTSAQPLSIVIAAGPFCCSEDMDYTPLRDLLRYVRDNNADALLLVGPFVDTDHPHVKSGALEVTFDDLFAQAVQTQVEDACDETPDLKVLLVPSVRDAHTDMVYPQPPLDLADFKATPGQVT
jgi:DNA polymerase alpha subunit B